jgi:hypothetical protein
MSIFDLASQSLTGAGGTLAQTVMPGAIGQSMNTYLSPYRTQVIDDAVGRLRDRKAVDMNQIKTNAYQSGAFGGSRHGLVEAETIDNYGRSEDELVARLLQQGFDTSAGLGVQEQQLMQSGAGQQIGLGQTAFGIGQGVQQGQYQAGGMQQQLLQALLGGASSQYDQYSNYPVQQLGTLLSALSGNPLSGNVSQSYQPGLFDYLSMGTGTYAAGK